MDENQVVKAVCDHLTASGCSDIKRLTTTQRGIDVTTVEESTGIRFYLEAKGGTSSRIGSNRYGKPYTSSQVFDRAAKGTYTCFRLRAKHRKKTERVILAVPLSDAFRRYLDPILPLLKQSRIEVWYVSSDGSVEVANVTAAK